MGKKTVYYCDCCNKEVGKDDSCLFGIMLPYNNWDSEETLVDYEVCEGCYDKYIKVLWEVKNQLMSK